MVALSFCLSLASSAGFSHAAGRHALPSHDLALVDCLTNRSVPVSVAGQSNFARLAKPYNTRLVYQPAAIALPTTSKQVSDAVLCAGRTGTKVQAKSGGHSYASYSSGGKDGSLVIDMKAFQEVTVDEATGLARVGTGVRLGNMASELYRQGRRALPHGTCPG